MRIYYCDKRISLESSQLSKSALIVKSSKSANETRHSEQSKQRVLLITNQTDSTDRKGNYLKCFRLLDACFSFHQFRTRFP